MDRVAEGATGKSTAEVYGSMTVDGTVEEGPGGTGEMTGRPMSIRMAANAEEPMITEAATAATGGTLEPAHRPTPAEGGRAEAGGPTVVVAAVTTITSDRWVVLDRGGR